MRLTRLSLYYRASYLIIFGVASPIAAPPTIEVLRAARDYGTLFPRLAGMLFLGLGLRRGSYFLARTPACFSA